MSKTFIAAALLAAAVLPAHAAPKLDLSRYIVTGAFGLDVAVGAVSGLEGSGITYARDRGSLFYVGDEGTGVIEVSRTGVSLGSMAFNWAGTGSTNQDTEGIAYLGGGVVVIGEERLQDLYRFNYVNGGTATLNASYVSISNATVGNNGMEGFTYDPRGTGTWITVKQQSPQDIRSGTLTFAGGSGGTATMSQLFNPTLMGVSSLSDVASLAPVSALAGTGAADHLLVLSLASRRLIEVDRSGTIHSSFDLTNVLPNNAIEGVTVDENGVIYLVAEQIQNGGFTPGIDPAKSYLVTLAPVPEPEQWALLAMGLALVGGLARRRAAR